MSLHFDLEKLNTFQEIYDYFLENKTFHDSYLNIFKTVFHSDGGVHVLVSNDELIRFTGLMEEEDVNFWVQSGWTVYTFTE